MTTHGPEPDWLGRVDRWARSHGWAADALATLAVLAVLGGLSVGGAQGIRWSAGWVAALIDCFAVLHLTVAVRSRAPEAAFLVAAAAMLVIVFAPDGRVTDHVPGGPTHVPALFLPSNVMEEDSRVQPTARTEEPDKPPLVSSGQAAGETEIND